MKSSKTPISSILRLLDGVYGSYDGHAERRSFCSSAGVAALYGEIRDIQTLLDHVQFQSDDVFFDLGSGIGRMVIQVFLLTPIKLAVGVELGPTRFSKSVEAKNAILESLEKSQPGLLH